MHGVYFYRVLQNLCNKIRLKLSAVVQAITHYYLFQIRNSLGSSVFKLCPKDSVLLLNTNMSIS